MNFKVGDKAKLNKSFSEADVKMFAEISHDNNPIHLNKVYAKETFFGERIVQGILVSGLISAVITNKLPGQGTVYLSQELNFKIPVYLNEIITAQVEVITIREDKPIVKLKTSCFKANGDLVIEGLAVVKLINLQ